MTAEQIERVRLSDVALVCVCGHAHGEHYIDLFGTPPATSAIFDGRRFEYGCDRCDCRNLRIP